MFPWLGSTCEFVLKLALVGRRTQRANFAEVNPIVRVNEATVVTNGVECSKGVNLGTAGTGNSVFPVNYAFQVFSPRMRGHNGNSGKVRYI